LLKKIILRLIGVGILAGAAYGGYRAVQGMQTREQVIADHQGPQGRRGGAQLCARRTARHA
jgi:hypothetical protein